MDIFLVRHGKYNQRNIDPNEGLNEEGRQEVLKLLDYLEQENIIFDKVLSSPKARAKETANLLRGSCKITETSNLSPSSSVQTAYDCIPKEGCVLVVSHLPLLEGLSELFGEIVQFRTATLAHYKEDGLHNIIFTS